MASIIQHDESTGWPGLGKSPRDVERTGDVVPAVDEHARYGVDPIRTSRHLVVAEEGTVTPVVGDEACEAHSRQLAGRRAGVR
jgi:hypothetical protein